MDRKKKLARAVVKANDALTKAKLKEKKDGTPVPQKLRDQLSKAIKAFESE